MATVYAIASAKGGVGKTTTTAAMATVLAESGADVVAIDADIGMANLADALGVRSGETTIHDVLAGDAEPKEAVHEGPSGLRVLPGATTLDAYAAADPSGLGDVVATFADADYVFLDAGAGLSHDSTLPLALADETVLVSTPDRSALGDTEKTGRLAERLGGTVAGAVITRVGSEAADAELEGLVEGILDADVLGWIPEDAAVSRASGGGSVVSAEPSAPVSRAYRELTRTLTGARIEEPADARSTDAEREAGGADGPRAGESGTETDASRSGADETGGEATTGAEDSTAEASPDAERVTEAEPDREPGDDPEDGTEEGSEDGTEEGSEDGADRKDDARGESEPVVDEELAGSVPFRDDDTATMEAAQSRTDDDDETDRKGRNATNESDDEKRGFFSRLLGR